MKYKLDKKKAKRILDLVKENRLRKKTIAYKFGVCTHTISRIINGREGRPVKY
jgi:DNA invertase Pin-like site-specific DNA recombinase